LGGVAIFVTFWGIVFAILAFWPHRLVLLSPDMTTIFVGALAIFLLGLFDDFHPLRARSKLAVQALVGIWLWSSGLSIDRLWVPTVGGVELGLASLPMTLVWFILLVNAVNIIDGLDGLAAGVCLIGLASVLVIGIRTDIPDAIILALILAGTLGGFLVYNRPPARIFLGDSGSLSLGYFFAVLALWLPIKRYTVVAVYVPVLALLVPLAEAAWSILRRIAGGQKPTTPDRGHLHFRLVERGISAAGVRLLFYCLSVGGLAFSLAAAYGNRRLWMTVFGFFILLLIIGLYILLRTPGRK
jgi:UDP-GlcNAc:undecaprenyl-phosphate GlcNAc-1-phosphate transferase